MARSRIAALVAFATFAVATPSRIYAEEAPSASTTPWLVPMIDQENLRPLILAERAQARVAIRGAATQELAVSREAGVIIIVCAIVVGVIILVAIGAPHL